MLHQHMKLYLIAGEASGDARGAELMQSLLEQNSALEFFGLGGAQMRAIAGGDFHDWVERAGVIGIIDVVKNYGYFKKQFDATLADIARINPDAVVLIDYPGFNLRLATALKKRGGSPRILYYISPQVWAWHQSRIPKMARVIDLMMCIFPFEKPLYEKSGLKTVFVGHPMIDSLGAKKLNVGRDEKLVGLFPGSRKREVRKIFPVMLEAAAEMQKARPDLRFEAAAASAAMLEMMQLIALEMHPVPCEIGLKNSHELMQRAGVGMVASGTATVEASFFRLPYVLIYRASWLTFFIGRRLVNVPWLGMVNIMAGREIVREFLQEEALAKPIANEVLRLAGDPQARSRIVAHTDEIIAMLGAPGASRRAATAILGEIKT